MISFGHFLNSHFNICDIDICSHVDLEILKNLHFIDNTTRTEESSKSFKIDPVIEHLNKAYKSAVEVDPSQSIDEHMIKFKGQSSIKQYIKSKPIKWGFKAWMRCASSTGYAF